MMYPTPVLIIYCFFTNKPDVPPVYIEKQRALKQFICSSYPKNSRKKWKPIREEPRIVLILSTKQSHKEPQKTAHFYGKSHRDCMVKQHTLQGKSIAIAAATHDHVAALCRL